MTDRTVLVTGATGYIAKHVVRRFLDAGDTVVGSVRRPDGTAELAAAVRPHLADPSLVDTHLRTVLLDLDRDEGWDEAMSDIDVLVHTASPVPGVEPRDPDEVIRPAVEGTERALRAAARNGVGRAVCTSSIFAIIYTPLPGGRHVHDERDWSVPDPRATNAYVRSKTLAERRAWELADELGLELTTINPGVVLGAPLDDHVGATVGIIRRLLTGRDPALPRIAWPIAHVEDAALAHLRATETDAAAGERFIVAGRALSWAEIGAVLREAHPERHVATRAAPNLVVRALALVDRSLATIVYDLGNTYTVDASKAAAVLGVTAAGREEDAIRETADHLIIAGLV